MPEPILRSKHIDNPHMIRLAEVQKKGKPICVDADGLNLVDDCGGINGYLRMLRTIIGKDRTEAAEMRGWARSLGWTGRKSKLENIL